MKIIAFLVSILFVVLAALHVFVAAVTIDVIAIMLLVLAALPWMLPYLKSFELPGGVKIELKDVKQAKEKVTEGEDESPSESSEYDYLRIISKQDPNLALVAIRIEIEKEVRANLVFEDNRKMPLSKAIRLLSSKGVITENVESGIMEFIYLGNQAAHGVEVEDQAARYLIENAAKLLKSFKEQLANVD